MTKQQMLDMAMTFSALESWACSLKAPLPDFLHNQISESIGILTKEILDEKAI